ncbi:hypothetical protein PIIN_00275 [Serendipita indica DSM 11827]|uniref:BRCT domain-containing protein n=1 Tax=Serendipita indica (strain DSM 11827) TaxID=1109443 RepID=G4T5M0_SERID|nr:hypothetical protein PIIN_00275 [Serendipita indica DSM 11827]
MSDQPIITTEKQTSKIRFSPYATRAKAEPKSAREDWLAKAKEQRALARSHRLPDVASSLSDTGQPTPSAVSANRKHVLNTLSHPGNPITNSHGLRQAGGYCANTTDLELKMLVTKYGGTVANTETGATHVLTSQSLSGGKLQRHLTQKTKVKTHIVKPEWLFDSIAKGKRRAEWEYNVIKSAAQPTLNVSSKPPSSRGAITQAPNE